MMRPVAVPPPHPDVPETPPVVVVLVLSEVVVALLAELVAPLAELVALVAPLAPVPVPLPLPLVVTVPVGEPVVTELAVGPPLAVPLVVSLVLPPIPWLVAALLVSELLLMGEPAPDSWGRGSPQLVAMRTQVTRESREVKIFRAPNRSAELDP